MIGIVKRQICIKFQMKSLIQTGIIKIQIKVNLRKNGFVSGAGFFSAQLPFLCLQRRKFCALKKENRKSDDDG